MERVFGCILVVVCTVTFLATIILALLGVKYAPFEEIFGNHAQQKTATADERPWDAYSELFFATSEEDLGRPVKFGDGVFYLNWESEGYTRGDYFDITKMAGEFAHGYNAEASSQSSDELVYVGRESTVIFHGSKSDDDLTYLIAKTFDGRSVKITLYETSDQRTLRIEDGSHVSPLARDLAQYAFELFYEFSEAYTDYFRVLERWEDSARAEVEIISVND